MASRRQELSQRRKAVGFTQESLAEQLGVERSTVIRWEAGDSEPLPSIRPNLAHALQVSIDHLAELLTNSENAATPQTPSADPEDTISALLPEVQPTVWPDQAEFENLIRPQIAETVEALRNALRSAGVSAEDLAAMLLVGGALQAPALDVSEPSRTEETKMPSQPQAKPRKVKRLVAAGAFALALPVFWLSAPFVISHGGPVPQGVAGISKPTAPVGASQDNGSRSADSTIAVHTAPSVTPAGGPTQPAAAFVPASQTARAAGNNRTSSRSIPSAATTHPLPRTPAEMIATAGAGQRWNRFDQFERVDHLW